MTTATKKNTRRALNVFLLLVGAVGFFMALGEALSTLIADEDKTKPLSDQAIEEHFAEMGINVSRRTIAKYRSQMDIPSASGRKHR